MDSDASEEHMAQDKFREKSLKFKKTVDSTLSTSFEKIVCSSGTFRAQAAAAVVKYLSGKQANQNGELCHELRHVLHRLVRGVGTPREEARVNLYGTLVCLLTTFPKIPLSDVVEVINKELVGGGSSTKSEKGEAYTGQVLTYGAVIQSGLLKSASSDDQQLVLTNLMTIASKRDYLLWHAFSFLILFAETVSRSVFTRVVWPVLEPRIGVPWTQQSFNTLHTLLWATERYPKVLNDDFYTKHLEDGFTCTSSLKHCLQLLMTPPRRAFLDHPVYETFCQRLVLTDQVVAFFDDVLDPYLADKAASGAADMAAAKILLYSAKHIKDKSQMCNLLTKQILQLLMRYGQQKRKQADPIGIALVSALKAIVDSLKDAEDDDKVKVVHRLLYNSELASSYRVVNELVPQLGKPGVLRLLDMHRDVMESSPTKKTEGKSKSGGETAPLAAAENAVAMAVQGYAQLLAHPIIQQDQKHRAQLTKPLIALGFLADEKVTHMRATQARAAFFKTLAQRTVNLSALREYLAAVVRIVNKLVFSSKAKSREPLTPEVTQAWKHMQEAVASLDGETKVAAAPLFHTMFLHLGLLLLSDASTAMEALEELHSCLERAVQSGTKLPQKVHLSEGALEEGEPEWVEVAVELLLSLLSRSANLLRGLVICVFPHLIPHLTPSALHQILSVLDVNSEQSLLYGSDESSSESEEEGEEDDDDDNDGEENENGVDNSEDEEDDVEGLSSDDNEEPVNERLKVALRQALWPAGTVLNSDDEDVEPTEEEGARLNAALASAFREFRGSKPGGRNSTKQSREDETLMHFRTRVLDLLESVVIAKPPMSACLDAIPSLMQLLQHCIQDPHQKALENRVRGCLRKLSTVRSWRDTEGVTPDRLLALLNSVLEKGERTAPLYLDMLQNTTAIATFILRCSHHISDGDASAVSAITDRYLQALDEFMTRRECLHNVQLYTKALALPWLGNFELATSLVDFAFSPIRKFRCGQALDLLSCFLRNKLLAVGAANEARRNEIVNTLLDRSCKLFTEKVAQPEPPLRPNFVASLAQVLRLALTNINSATKSRCPKLGDAVAAFVYGGGVKGPSVGAIQSIAGKLDLKLDMKKVNEAIRKQTAPKINGKAVNGKSNETIDGVSVKTNGISHSEDEAEENKKEEKRMRKEKRKLKRALRQAAESQGESKEDHTQDEGSRMLSKKASRELRQTAMSEGFEESVFHTGLSMEIDGTDEAVEENGVAENGEKKKKNRTKRLHEGEVETKKVKKKKLKNKT